jgi:broad specificity phosphatase PhoE
MTDFQQFIVIRHGESQTNATNTFQAGNQYDSDPLTHLEWRMPAASRSA